MESTAKLIYIGDVNAQAVGPALEAELDRRYKKKKEYEVSLSIAEPVERIAELAQNIEAIDLSGTNVAVLLLGIADIQANTSEEKFIGNYKKIIEYLQSRKMRVVISTLPPLKGQSTKKINKRISALAEAHQVRLARLSYYWGKEEKQSGELTPTAARLVVEAMTPVIIRTKMLVLWQFNGRYAHCNYGCPYCYVATSVNKGMHFNFDMETWEKAFTKHFGDKDTVFYFSYGEPMMASKFYDVLEMIGRHKNWQVRMTTNLSLPLARLFETQVVKEGRMNINASYHPTEVSIDKFMAQVELVRAHGIEPSIVYVMYPGQNQIDDFEAKYMPRFREAGLRVHIRAFRGLYKGRKYPGGLTKDQWKKTAKYIDRANFKYELGEVNGLGRLSMLGMTHILVDNDGKIEMCDSYVGDRHYGNIFDDRLSLDIEPKPFPGLVPLAAVDDIADYVEVGYEDLVGNNVNDFNTQGGTIKKEDGTIEYPYEFVDFDKEDIKELQKVPKPTVPAWKFWFNPRWFGYHFVYSFVIKKYGKYVFAWVKGKYRLLKKGKLTWKNFWHG